MAETRLLDAQALLAASQWSGAYYLSGYAVECALKATIFRDIQKYSVPDKDLVSKSYTHSLEVLIKLAGLLDEMRQEQDARTSLGLNWMIVKDWTEASRYELWDEASARDMVNAIDDPREGVFSWIRNHW